jgi:hypothetical protein
MNHIFDAIGTDTALEIAELFGMEPGVVYDDVAGTLWETVAMEYEAAKGSERVTMISEGDEISWVGRQYTDDQIGKLDGPGRDVNWDTMAGILPAYKGGRTAKGRMTRRQRKALKKAERAAKRAEAKASDDMVDLVLA